MQAKLNYEKIKWLKTKQKETEEHQDIRKVLKNALGNLQQYSRNN